MVYRFQLDETGVVIAEDLEPGLEPCRGCTTGKILAQRPVEPCPGASVFESTAVCFREGAELLAAAIRDSASSASAA